MAAAAGVLVALGSGPSGAAATERSGRALIGEARRGSVTVRIAPALDVVVFGGDRAAGRPIVVIDPGHGGRDPGAVSVSGAVA